MEVTNPRRFRLVTLTTLALVAVLVVSVWQSVAGDLPLSQSGEFVVPEGSTAASVWASLVDQGYTERALPWRYHAWRQDAAARLKAGTYQLEAGERISAVIARFVSGDTSPDELTLTFPEGFTVEQMAERTAAQNIGTKQEFLTAAQPAAFAEQYPFLADVPAERNLEGYLFPDTYQVFADDTSADVVARQLATFNKKIVESAVAASSERTLDEIMIMASIVEREVISDSDMARVAGVLWQRYDDGAGLDADATVRYALSKWDEPLTVNDLASDSLYNTRRWKGLPPGPISNPGLRAIQAAANPEKTDFYYYLSTPQGETIFSKTNDEHNQNKAKYLK